MIRHEYFAICDHIDPLKIFSLKLFGPVICLMDTIRKKEESRYAQQERSVDPEHIAGKLSELLQAGLQLCASGSGCDGNLTGKFKYGQKQALQDAGKIAQGTLLSGK